MISLIAAVLLGSAAAAAPAPAPAETAASVKPSTAAASSPLVGLSTYTISTLYTGDRVRDPFLPASVGGAVRVRDKSLPTVADIHNMQLRGIMKDSTSEFALFSSDEGGTMVLRNGRLYDDRGKPVAGISGRIQIKQKRAELMTADKDVQVYSLGETDEEKDKAAKP